MLVNHDLSYSANVIIFREMESRAGGLVRLPGSVGARPEGQAGAGLPDTGSERAVGIEDIGENG